jgi:hypothetical protein
MRHDARCFRSSAAVSARICFAGICLTLVVGATAQQPNTTAPQTPDLPVKLPDLAHQDSAQSGPTSAKAAIADSPEGLAAAATTTPPTVPVKAASITARTATSADTGKQLTDPHETSAITEDELRKMLIGKVLYLRGGHLGDSLHYDLHGQPVDHGPQVPYTLSLVEISKVSLNKRLLELEGVRYGLHFEDALPSLDPMQTADKVRITPRKKTLKIAIDREEIEKVKKEKPKKNADKSGASKPAQADGMSAAVDPQMAFIELKKTTSVAQANKALRDAVDQVFAHGLDDRLLASLPDFWKLYYQAAAAGTDYRPQDPAILRQNSVDQKARLLTTFEPPSNDFAQVNGVAGIAVYRVSLGANGKPTEIAAARPIGFGLDENAVASIRKASFQPAIKDDKPVPVMLDMIVQFRIYSNRTAVMNQAEMAKKQIDAASLPGPYSARQP